MFYAGGILFLQNVSYVWGERVRAFALSEDAARFGAAGKLK